ncbi:MAG: DedA family protein [Candidatus Limnocylindria bacterium]
MIESLGLAALFAVLLVKEAGVPIPVPGDLLVLAAGVAAARGDVDPIAALAVILAAGLLGGWIQYVLARSAFRRPLMATLDRFGVRRERIEAFAERLRRQGGRGVAVARMTPGIRVVAVAASGMADVPIASFLGGLAVGNAVFAGAHFGLGLVVGEPGLRLVSAAAAPLAVAGVALAAVGGVVWWLLHRRRATSDSERVAGFAAWVDAACPACIGFAAVEAARGVTGSPGRKRG